MCVELRGEEKKWLARENGHDLEYAGLLSKCVYGTVDASARWHAHYGRFLKEHGFVQGLSNPSLFMDVDMFSSIHVF